MANGNFKKALFGFSSRSVLEYIEQVQAEAVATQNELNARISELENKIGAAEQLASIKSSECDALSAELVMLRGRLEEKEQEADSLRRECEKNDDIRNRVGDIFIEARTNANSIIDNARSNAHRLESTAAHCAETAVNNIDRAYEELQQLRDNMRTTFDDFCRRLSEMGDALEGARREISHTTAPAPAPVPVKQTGERRVIKVAAFNKVN